MKITFLKSRFETFIFTFLIFDFILKFHFLILHLSRPIPSVSTPVSPLCCIFLNPVLHKIHLFDELSLNVSLKISIFRKHKNLERKKFKKKHFVQFCGRQIFS